MAETQSLASLLSYLKGMPPKKLARKIGQLDAKTADSLLHVWELRRREDQVPPPGDWLVWLVMGGRGSGKTRLGAEWTRDQVKNGFRRIALVAETAADARDVMVEGDSGILNVCHAGDRDNKGRHIGVPKYEPSKRRLTWANGAIATLYNAREPNVLRGPQHDAAWADEVAKWRYGDAWDQLMFGLRLGDDPRCCATTTPRPRKLITNIQGEDGTVVTGTSTYANRANLASKFVDRLIKRYEGTRLGRQELHGELLTDVQGALWSLDQLDLLRVEDAPDLRRIVVAVDPAISTEEGSDETGIIVAALGEDGHFYVLADLSSDGMSPAEWGKKVVRAYHRYGADRIVAERNQGGDMVHAVIQQAAKDLKTAGAIPTDVIAFRSVWATRGKALRAEPISALYEQGRAHHVGAFHTLEDQMAQFTIDFDRKVQGYSPDRLDALVWAGTELMLGGSAPTVDVADVQQTNPFAT